MRTFSPSPWPSTVWEDLPLGYDWIALTQCCTGHVWIRETGSDSVVRLPGDLVLPLDRTKRYQLRNIGALDVDQWAVPGPTVATVQRIDLVTECVLGVGPLPYVWHTVGRAAFSVTKVQAAALTLGGTVWRMTLDPLNEIFGLVASAGVITWAGLLYYDPAVGAVGTQAATVAALNNWARAVGVRRGMAYDAATGYFSQWGSRGIGEYIAFPVTTTPTVLVAYNWTWK